MKPTTGYGPPREAGPHGVTLDMLAVKRPEPVYVKQFFTEADKSKSGAVLRVLKVGDWSPHANPDRDRSLPGKARRRARKAARGLARRAFFKGHGIASENAYNLRYECPCGFGIIAPLDDFEFMADVMEHEDEHREDVSA